MANDFLKMSGQSTDPLAREMLSEFAKQIIATEAGA
jgi:hypothetical protein